MTSSSILTPLTGLVRLPMVFAKLQEGSGGGSGGKSSKGPVVDLTMPKILYVILNMIWLGVGLYKMSQMRLLPTTSADWSGRIVWKEMMEISSIPVV